MASFDLVSKIDEMELANALKNTEKMIQGRYDFKGSDAGAEYKEKEKILKSRLNLKCRFGPYSISSEPIWENEESDSKE
jgi:cyclic-di-GMP-binding protein